MRFSTSAWMRFAAVCALAIALLGGAVPARAQQTVNGYTFRQDRLTQIAQHEWALVGHAEIQRGDVNLYADEIDFFEDEDRAVATGNVLLSQGLNRIGADSADFDTKAGLGIFYHAYGVANVQPPRRNAPAAPGSFLPPPPPASQDTDVYFFGDIVEKIGPRKYKVTNGGFTTCLQPTPRWNLTAKTIVVNIDHYTLLEQMVLNVKGVPMFYLPFMYYPTKRDERATGFLIPTYSSSSVLGSSIQNAFFWAIDRSQDLTVQDEWYSKMGQGLGAEYRYNWGAGNSGALQALWLLPKANPGANLPIESSFDVHGSADQMLPGRLRARGSVNYFSDLQANQLFNNNLAVASYNVREYAGNVVGAWRNYALNANFDHAESFYTPTTSVITGETPRISVIRNERPVFAGSPLYFGATTDIAHISNETKSNGTINDLSMNRVDASPAVRYPFKKWQFLTVNSSVIFHDTFYSRSYDQPYEVTDPTAPPVVNSSLNRAYTEMRADITGPSFNRIFDTPGNGYAERFKHVIEPTLSLSHVTTIDDGLRLRILNGDRGIVGGTTNITYGLTNRLLAKQKVGQVSQAVEILSVNIQQSHYTNHNASQFDAAYQATPSTTVPSNFSPVLLTVRATPTQQITADVRTQFDSRTRDLTYFSLNSSYNWTTRIRTSAGWTRNYYEHGQPAIRTKLSDALNSTITAQTADNRFGGTYALNYDFLNSPHFQQQTISGFYNAQCCGLSVGYQTRPLYFGFGVPDHRFMFSVTLAGLGSVSPFNGGMGGNGMAAFR